MKTFFPLALVWVGAMCAKPSSPPPDAAYVDFDADAGSSRCEDCRRYGPLFVTGKVEESELVEISGLVASRAQPGVYFAHNDSGDTARFFAMNDAGQKLGEFRLNGASARDWEDIAWGPCPSGSCLFLADFGDNRQVRNDYALYRVAEPQVSLEQPGGSVEVSFERLDFVYPGGAKHNAEALVVDPQSGVPYVLTKRPAGEPSEVFRFPSPPTSGAQLEKVGDLPVPGPQDASLTAADFHPCGGRLLLRTYTKLYQLTLPPGAPFEAVFTAQPVEAPVASEIQGEAVAFRADGLGYLTVSEGAHPALNAARCK